MLDHLLGYCHPHCTGSAECRRPCPALLQAALVEYLDSCEVHGLATPSSMHTRFVKLMLELGGHHQVSRWRACICLSAGDMPWWTLSALYSRPAEPALVGESSGANNGR